MRNLMTYDELNESLNEAKKITIETEKGDLDGTYNVEMEVSGYYYVTIKGKGFVISWDGKEGFITKQLKSAMAKPGPQIELKTVKIDGK